MASSLYKAQFALKLCEKHDKKELIAYCNTCKDKICSSCIKEDHTSHDWETITDILREKKRSLPEECKEIRSKQISGLKRELSCFDTKIEDEDARFEQNKSTLNRSRESYINKINQLFDDKIDECRQKSEDAKQIYKDKHDKLKQKVDYLEMMTTSLDKDINTLPDHDILDMEKEMRDELEKALDSADKYTCTTVFVPGQMEIQALEKMIGEIHNVSIEEMYDIGKYSAAISSVKPVSETKALVRVDHVKYPELINTAGDVVRNIDITCTDLIISNSRNFVLTSNSKCTISVLTGKKDILTTIDTKPLHPTFISSTENDDILVTLRDDDDRYNLVPTSHRIVQRMTLTGEVLNTYEFQDDGKTRLFTYPVRTTTNKNSDVCVINWLSNDNGELVVLYRDGRLRFIYGGDGMKSGKFFTSDVECDDKCRILFTEKYSRAIHMLTAEGMYLCALCQYEQIRPYVISLHDQNLWCGFKEGRIKVLQYRN